MFSSYFMDLKKDAFIRPERKESVPRDYKKLYGDEVVIHEYVKETKEREIKEKETKEVKTEAKVEVRAETEPKPETQDTPAESRQKFQTQFLKLMDALKEWGIKNDCGTPERQQEIEACKEKFFDQAYSGNQSAAFFNIIKKNLEQIWFILNFDKSVPDAKKKSSFTQLCKSLSVCAPGLYTHIEDILNTLTAEISPEYFLAELRTNIIKTLADVHNAAFKIREGDTIHTYNAFLIFAQNEGWAPLSDIADIIDPFASVHTKVDGDALVNLSAKFVESYTPRAIADCIFTNFYLELNKTLKELSIQKLPKDWIPCTDELLKKIDKLANIFGFKEGDLAFFEYSDDFKSMRINKEVFKEIFLRSCQQQEKFFSRENWRTISLENGYKVHCIANNTSWVETPHDEPVNWQDLPAGQDKISLLKTFLEQLPEKDWPAISDLKSIISTPPDLVKLIKLFSDKNKINKIINEFLGTDYLSRMIKNIHDATYILKSFPGQEKWKSAEILSSAGTLFIKDIITFSTAEFFQKLLPYIKIEKNLPELLNCAVQFGQIGVISLLRERKADLNCQDEDSLSPIYVAAKYKHANVIKYLHEHKADLYQVNKIGHSAAHAAAYFGSIEALKALVECKLDFNLLSSLPSSKDVLSVAHLAAANGRSEMIQFLAECKVNLEATSRDGFTLGCYAAKRGHLGVLKVLAENKVDWEKPSANGVSPLLLACQNHKYNVTDWILGMDSSSPELSKLLIVNRAIVTENLTALKKLVECKISINGSGNSGDIPIHFAAVKNKPAVLRTLLELNANIDQTNDKGGSALDYVAGNTECLKILVEYKANLNIVGNDGRTPILIAARSGHANVVNLLAENKADVNQVDNKGMNIANLAMLSDAPLETIKELVTLKADFYKKDNAGDCAAVAAFAAQNTKALEIMLNLSPPPPEGKDWSCEFRAAYSGDVNFLKTIAEAKIHLDISRNGLTTAYIAAKHNQLNVLALLANYSDFQKGNANGYTLAHYAAENNHLSTLQFWHEHKYDVNLATKLENLTPAHCAAKNNQNADVIKRLHEYKANFDLQDMQGNTPAITALRNGNMRVLQVLAECKANLNLMNQNGITLIHILTKTNFCNPATVKLLMNHKADFTQLDKNHKSPLSYAIEKTPKLIDWNSIVIILTSIKSENLLPLERNFLSSHRAELTEAFINNTRNMRAADIQSNTHAVVKSENALGVILNTPGKRLGFFEREISGAPTKKIQRIMEELKYNPDHKEVKDEKQRKIR